MNGSGTGLVRSTSAGLVWSGLAWYGIVQFPVPLAHSLNIMDPVARRDPASSPCALIMMSKFALIATETTSSDCRAQDFLFALGKYYFRDMGYPKIEIVSKSSYIINETKMFLRTLKEFHNSIKKHSMLILLYIEFFLSVLLHFKEDHGVKSSLVPVGTFDSSLYNFDKRLNACQTTVDSCQLILWVVHCDLISHSDYVAVNKGGIWYMVYVIW